MSTKDVELIHVRLKEELARLSLKPAVAAKMAGEGDSQGLRDVLGGRKRLSAELLAALAAQGVDSRYVLSGQRDGPAPEALTADEQVLLDGYRALDPATRKRVLAFILSGEPAGGGKVIIHGKVGQQVEKIEGGVNIDMRDMK